MKHLFWISQVKKCQQKSCRINKLQNRLFLLNFLPNSCCVILNYSVCFSGVNVPRSRFLPVKTSSDLFLVMSNLYDMHSGTLTMNHRRMFATTPLIKITGPHFKKVSKFFYLLCRNKQPGWKMIIFINMINLGKDKF